MSPRIPVYKDPIAVLSVPEEDRDSKWVDGYMLGCAPWGLWWATWDNPDGVILTPWRFIREMNYGHLLHEPTEDEGNTDG